MAKSPKHPSDSPAPKIDPKWSWHYRTLRELRQRLLEQEVAQLKDVFHPATSADEPVERAETELARDFTFTLLARETDALAQIDEALHRIEHGTYGICLSTGLPIPAERLKAVPWTRYVREVKARQEPHRT